MTCTYSRSLGVPGEGVHRHVLGFAIVDVLATVLLASLMARGDPRETVQYFIWLFILAQLLHWMMCVDTAFLRKFHLNTWQST
jgi:hypothetical protein